ncbi:hypothetical protein JTB14_027558 [Gonioctena quinquepunctata]|nr:hypothetical protein JTB14_027558 [Gonioctena quinquepunctata]
MRAVCFSNWVADPSISLLLYRIFIRSEFDYGSIAFSQAPTSHFKRLDCVTTKCMRLSLEAMKSTPNSNLESNKTVKFAWVKAHCGIIDNEKVDSFAETPTTMDLTYKNTSEDMTIEALEKSYQKWEKSYFDSTKGTYYKAIQLLVS